MTRGARFLAAVAALALAAIATASPIKRPDDPGGGGGGSTHLGRTYSIGAGGFGFSVIGSADEWAGVRDSLPPAAPTAMTATKAAEPDTLIALVSWVVPLDDQGYNPHSFYLRWVNGDSATMDAAHWAGAHPLAIGYLDSITVGSAQTFTESIPHLEGQHIIFGVRYDDPSGNLGAIDSAGMVFPVDTWPPRAVQALASAREECGFTWSWTVPRDSFPAAACDSELVRKSTSAITSTLLWNNANVAGASAPSASPESTATTPYPVSAAADTTYYLAVRYTDAAGNLGPLVSASQQGHAFHSTITGPAATAATSVDTTSFVANWNHRASVGNSGTPTYTLDVAASRTFSGFLSGYDGLATGTDTARVVTGLDASTKYYWRARALDSGGCGSSAVGAIDSATTSALPDRIGPKACKIATLTQTDYKLTANWTAVADSVSLVKCDSVIVRYRAGMDIASEGDWSTATPQYSAAAANVGSGQTFTTSWSCETDIDYAICVRYKDAAGNLGPIVTTMHACTSEL